MEEEEIFLALKAQQWKLLGPRPVSAPLVETTTVLASSIRNIYERWRNAPDDLLTLAALLVSIGARLDIVQCSAIESHALAIDAKSQLFLERLLEEARECILQFEDILVRVQRYGNFRQRAMWAVQEKQRMDKTMGTLRFVEEQLSSWLQTVML